MYFEKQEALLNKKGTQNRVTLIICSSRSFPSLCMQPSNLSVQFISMFRIWRLREYEMNDHFIRAMKATALAASNTSTVFIADRSSFVLISTYNWFQPITSHLSDHKIALFKKQILALSKNFKSILIIYILISSCSSELQDHSTP